jgi:uncharacterized surface protein with fasciclin (FAS1) repeats
VQFKNTLGIALFTSTMLAGAAIAQCGAGAASSAKPDCGATAQASGHVMTVGFVHEQEKANIVDTAVKAGMFKTLVAALTAADWAEALKGEGPFTVFAPTDDAFAKLPAGTIETWLKPENKATLASVLKYHVVKGSNKADKVVGMTNATTLNGQRVDIMVKESNVWLDKAKVTKTDIECSNGVIHVIDTVLMPSTKNVVETAMADGHFKTLTSLLTAADWAEALKGDGPFTVFAPTDEAFAKLPKATLESLMKPEGKEMLVSILKYHVVSGRVFSDDAAKMTEGKTLGGASFMVSKKGDTLMIDKAKVTKADIDASNGVIHVIDTVLMPK